MDKRRLLHSVSLPRASKRQSPSEPLKTIDGSSALNIRECMPGILTNDTLPSKIAEFNAKPIYADKRLGNTNIFTINQDGVLCHDFTICADYSQITINHKLGTIANGDCSVAQVGDFLVVKDGDNRLFFILWNRQTNLYHWLGEMPTMPQISVEASSTLKIVEQIEGFSFPKSTPDLRTEIPSEISDELEQRVNTAVKAVHQRAAKSGLYTSPTLVRFAVRLWDNSIIHLSEPILIAPCSDVQPSRVSIPLIQGDSGYTGTASTYINIEAYSIKATLNSQSLYNWKDIVSGIEIWVSKPTDVTSATTNAKTVYNNNGNTDNLYVFPAVKTAEEMTKSLFQAGFCRVATLSLTDKEQTITPGMATNEINNSVIVSSARTPMLVAANAINGHGAFLHVSGYSQRLPKPQMPQCSQSDTQSAKCIVTVKLASLSGERYISAEKIITCNDAHILPMVWYPDATATEMTIQLQYDDGRLFERSFPLHKANTGEDCAYWQPESTDCIILKATDKLSIFPESSTIIDSGDGDVMTMKRGNPFVKHSQTDNTTGCISHIAAQRRGGGAYTRQYIYLFSDNGISALTHSMNGEHKNCRPISGKSVSQTRQITTCDDGVFALCDNGSLIRIIDSKIEILITGIDNTYRLAANEEDCELWLIPQNPDQHVIVISTTTMPDGEIPVRLSSFIPDNILQSSGKGFFICYEQNKWIVRTHIKRDETKLPALWESPIEDYPLGGTVALVAALREDVDANVSVQAMAINQDTSDTGETLISADIKAKCGENITIPFIIPNPKLYPLIRNNRLRLILKGDIGNFKAFGFEHIDNG